MGRWMVAEGETEMDRQTVARVGRQALDHLEREYLEAVRFDDYHVANEGMVLDVAGAFVYEVHAAMEQGNLLSGEDFTTQLYPIGTVERGSSIPLVTWGVDVQVHLPQNGHRRQTG